MEGAIRGESLRSHLDNQARPEDVGNWGSTHLPVDAGEGVRGARAMDAVGQRVCHAHLGKPLRGPSNQSGVVVRCGARPLCQIRVHCVSQRLYPCQGR